MKIKKTLYFFLVSCLLTVFLSSTLLLMTLLNSRYMMKLFQKNNIYEIIAQSTLEEMHNYIYQSGFNEEVLTSLFTKEEIEKSFKEMTKSIYKNVPFVLDTKVLERNLEKNIKIILEKNNIMEYEEEALNNFKKEIIDTYKNNIDLKSFLGNVPEYIVIVKNVIITIVMISGIGFFFIYLYLKNDRKKAISISLFFSGCVFFSFYFFIKASINIESIQFFNECISKLIVVLLNNLLKQFLGIAILCIFCGLLFCFEKKREVL